MKKRHLILLMLTACTTSIIAQSQTISGSIKSSVTSEVIPAVSVVLKGSSSGTFTDTKGNFRLVTSRQPPFTLVISSVGYETQEVAVSSSNETVQVNLVPASVLGSEVVVSASRVPERILESPVSIERMSTADIRNAAVPNFYEGMSHLKGVDLTTSSLTFRTVSTRGFNGSGNLRFNQFVDGIDNQAPGLNFAVGNVVGPTELDVDNVELLPGASSALYGSGGINGTLLMTSKDPFKYQGVSLQLKQGIMHVDGSQHTPSPYYDWDVRWGQKISDKFAFKLSSQYISAKDWQARDYRDFARNNISGTIKAGDRTSDPNYDGINVFGDEASASMNAFSQAVLSQVPATGLAAIRGLAAMGLTPQQIATTVATTPQLAPLAQAVPFVLGYGSNVFGNSYVSRTGYNENDLVNYDAYNLKVNGGLYYNITDNIQASLIGYWGTGTTVYTGGDRYSIKNLKMGQYKLELKSKNWFVRGYTVQENSGDSYTATTAAIAINNSWKSNQNWFQQYTGTYAAARLGIVPNPAGGGFLPAMSDAQANALARSQADAGRLLPGTDAYNQAFNTAISIPISKGGAKFEDRTDMYNAEGQLNLTDYVKVANVLVGANYRLFKLNSNGTIFADTAGAISVYEYGAYIQLQKSLLNEKLKLTVSGRYDKNQNFSGRFTPRATALITVAKDNNIRLSYQQAYRFPDNQAQWINLQTPGAKLIGGLPNFNTFYHFDASPVYTAESVTAYRASGPTYNPALLVVAPFRTVKPETVNSYEIGYRGLVTKHLLIDAYGYFSHYQNFISRTAVARGQSASTNPLVSYQELASPFTTTNYSFSVNTGSAVDAIGWGISFDYQFNYGFNATANISSDQLNNVPANYFTQFNTPKLRYNIGVGNNKIVKNFGFNVIYRWQDQVDWQGTFASGQIPAFGTLDGQVTYRLPKAKTQVKLGASNLLNKYYYSALGNPQIGGTYYLSIGYNIQ